MDVVRDARRGRDGRRPRPGTDVALLAFALPAPGEAVGPPRRALSRPPLVATGPIGGGSGTLRRIFVQSKEEFVMPRVEHVEIFGGNDAGRALYEKFVPGK